MGGVWNIIGTMSRAIIRTQKIFSPSAPWPGEYGEAGRGCHNNFDITQPIHPLPLRVLPHRKSDEGESGQLSPSASSPGEYPEGERGCCGWALIESGGLLDDIEHLNDGRYAHQRQYVVLFNKYVYCVPYVVDGDVIFLKTIYPSRKLTRKYLSGAQDG
jgi:hypothetical protein